MLSVLKFSHNLIYSWSIDRKVGGKFSADVAGGSPHKIVTPLNPLWGVIKASICHFTPLEVSCVFP